MDSPRLLNGYFTWFERRPDWGAISIRLAVGVRLVQGTADNVFDYGRMKEFAGFLSGAFALDRLMRATPGRSSVYRT